MLTTAERWWAAVYALEPIPSQVPHADWWNAVLITTFLSFTLHFVVYYARFLPFLLCDHVPALRNHYKIQGQKDTTPEMLGKCMRTLLFQQFFVQLPLQIMFHPMAEAFGMEIASVPFPSWSTMAWQVLVFAVLEDFYHYWAHRALHYGPLYKHIHKVHHEFQAPFGIAAEYAHPVETMVLGVGTIGGPLAYVAVTGNLHIVTVFAWLVVRLLQTVDAHSGYDFPWSLHRLLPFWAGADFHDHHHMVFLGNYSSTFRWWDWAFGTDARYNAWKARQQQKVSTVDNVKPLAAGGEKEE